MSDVEIYLTRCYDMILTKSTRAAQAPTELEEECVCANLIQHADQREKN